MTFETSPVVSPLTFRNGWPDIQQINNHWVIDTGAIATHEGWLYTQGVVIIDQAVCPPDTPAAKRLALFFDRHAETHPNRYISNQIAQGLPPDTSLDIRLNQLTPPEIESHLIGDALALTSPGYRARCYTSTEEKAFGLFECLQRLAYDPHFQAMVRAIDPSVDPSVGPHKRTNGGGASIHDTGRLEAYFCPLARGRGLVHIPFAGDWLQRSFVDQALAQEGYLDSDVLIWESEGEFGREDFYCSASFLAQTDPQTALAVFDSGRPNQIIERLKQLPTDQQLALNLLAQPGR